MLFYKNVTFENIYFDNHIVLKRCTQYRFDLTTHGSRLRSIQTGRANVKTV